MKTPFLALLVLLLSACTPLPVESPTSLVDSDWYTVYFSRPDLPEARSYRGGPDAALAEAIDAARASVDLAIHDLDLWSLRDALIDAHRRGLSVRLVVESENIRVPEIQELIQAGLPVVEDRNLERMHNKFAVIDRYEVWTGSMNFTVNGAYKNDNNLIRIRSSRLAENYTAEFEEMFLDGRYSDRSPADTPYAALNIDGTLIETFFAPEDGAAERIIELIDAAQESIHFMAFSLTSDPIADALLDAHERSVEITGIFEESQFEQQGGEYVHLLKSGIDVYLDGNPAAMHHKVIIIDARIVITGSYNFSRNAEERNDENLLILYNPDIALLFLQEFQRVLALAR